MSQPTDTDRQTLNDAEDHAAQRAARSPLALVFEVVACELATTHEQAEAVIPTYTFQYPCIRGKAIPDQDCRTCPHHRIARVGAGDTSGTHRYLHAGMVLPLSEEDAGKVLDLLALHDVLPLNRPHWEAAQRVRLAERAVIEARQAQARAGEAQQAGPYGAPTRGEP